MTYREPVLTDRNPSTLNTTKFSVTDGRVVQLAGERRKDRETYPWLGWKRCGEKSSDNEVGTIRLRPITDTAIQV
jgi:hypothetical protein